MAQAPVIWTNIHSNFPARYTSARFRRGMLFARVCLPAPPPPPPALATAHPGPPPAHPSPPHPPCLFPYGKASPAGRLSAFCTAYLACSPRRRPPARAHLDGFPRGLPAPAIGTSVSENKTRQSGPEIGTQRKLVVVGELRPRSPKEAGSLSLARLFQGDVPPISEVVSVMLKNQGRILRY